MSLFFSESMTETVENFEVFMNKIRLRLPILILALMSFHQLSAFEVPSPDFNPMDEPMGNMKLVKPHFTEEQIKKHQEICQSMGMVDISDTPDAEIRLSEGALDGFGCMSVPGMELTEEQKENFKHFGGIQEVPPEDFKKKMKFYDSSSMGYYDALLGWYATIQAPNGFMPYDVNFYARSLLTWQLNPSQRYSGWVSVNIPADGCSNSMTFRKSPGLNGYAQVFVLCHSWVIGGVRTYARGNVGGHNAAVNGTIFQYN